MHSQASGQRPMLARVISFATATIAFVQLVSVSVLLLHGRTSPRLQPVLAELSVLSAQARASGASEIDPMAMELPQDDSGDPPDSTR